MGRQLSFRQSIRFSMQTAPYTQPKETLPIASEVRCGYMGKTCPHPRSLKRDGRLHRFCMYHRERANLNQRRVDARKRLKGHAQERELSEKEYEDVRRREEELERQLESGGCWLNDQELDFLSYLLFDDRHCQASDHGHARGHPDANQMW